jgi:predicted AlkP superfamily phosphohydrolase/phosphomutase
MPDLVIEPVDGYVFSSSSNSFTDELCRSIDRDTDKFLGIHALDGIFVFNGQAVSAHKGVGLNLYDIIPTILYYMNLPIPENIDGKVYSRIFKREFPQNTVRFTKNIEMPTSVDKLKADEEQEIANRLRSLGYM